MRDTPWPTNDGTTHRERFIKAFSKEFENAFESNASWQWPTMRSLDWWRQEVASNPEKYPHGAVHTIAHPLAGIKGYEKLGTAEESEVKAKARVVMREERDLQTGKPRDGRVPGEVFGSMIPDNITSTLNIYCTELKQQMAAEVDLLVEGLAD